MSTLTTNVPTSLDTPGTYVEFVHEKTGGSLVALPLRVLLVGMMATSGTATAATPVRILSESDAITLFGQGSEMHLMAAKAFEQGLLNEAAGRGGMPELWGDPIAAPSGGGTAAAIETLTVTVTTATAGNSVLRIAGRTLTVGVAAGDSATTIAAAIAAAITARARELPVTAAAVAEVVSCTHVTKGEHGNDVAYQVVSTPSGVSIALAQSVAGAGVIDITVAVDAAVDKNYDAVAVSLHSAAAVSDAAAHLTAMWGYAQKMWRWVFLGDRASLGTAQGYATGANNEHILISSCESCPNLPSEIAVAVATAAFGVEAPNANYDDVELALYPPPSSSAYTAAEEESAIDGGVTPLMPSFDGTRLRLGRLITTKITENNAPYNLLADLAYTRTEAYRATQYDVNYRQRFRQEVIDGGLSDPDATLLKRIRDMCVAVDRQMGARGYLRDVEKLVKQIRVDEADAPAGRLIVDSPLKVAGPLHQVVFKNRNYL
jgi:phage tail sheath gpL-like